MKIRNVTKDEIIPRTVYEKIKTNKDLYISDDGLKESFNKYEIETYEKSLIEDKIFHKTPLEQLPNEENYCCGFAYYIDNIDDLQLFKKKYMDGYNYDLDEFEKAKNKWFTYYIESSNGYRDYFYFIFLDEIKDNAKKTLEILSKLN